MPANHFRAHARRNVSLPALVSSAPGDWERRARVVNLGLGGACLEIAGPVQPAEPLTVVLTTPTLWDPLTVAAQVAWQEPSDDAEPHRVGVRFAYGAGAPLDALVEIVATSGYE